MPMCVVAGYGKRVSDPLKTSATRPPTIFGIFEKILLLFRLEGMGHLEISCKHAVGTSAVLRQKDAGLFREVAEAAALGRCNTGLGHVFFRYHFRIVKYPSIKGTYETGNPKLNQGHLECAGIYIYIYIDIDIDIDIDIHTHSIYYRQYILHVNHALEYPHLWKAPH